jgi:hypothetical protein
MQGSNVEDIDDVGRPLIKEYPQEKHTNLSKGDGVSTAQLYLGKVQSFYFAPFQMFALWGAIRRSVLGHFRRCRL